MDEVTSNGRTVLFVSHNLSAIQTLCSRAILLNSGQIVADGAIDDVIGSYLSTVQNVIDEQALETRNDRVGGELFRFKSLEFLRGEDLMPIVNPISGQDVAIRLRYTNCTSETLENVSLDIGFYTSTNQPLFVCRSSEIGVSIQVTPGEHTSICRISKWPLRSGDYLFNLMARNRGTVVDWIKEAGMVYVEGGDYYVVGVPPIKGGRAPLLVDFDWQI